MANFFDYLINLVLKIFSYFEYNSVVVLTYFFISLIALILNKLTNKKSNELLFTCRHTSLLNPLTYVRLVTHSIGHRDFSHFCNNFSYILLLGPMIEEKYGSLNLLYMILLTSLTIGIINTIFSRKAVIGASGITFMMIVLSSFVNFDAGKIPFTLALICIFHVFDEVFSMNKKDGVSHLGHFVGAVCGGIFGFYFK